jgi:hypothetical protein
MLVTQPDDTDQQNQNQKDDDDLPPRMAWVARTRSGSEQHNTLTPVWEFAFSV